MKEKTPDANEIHRTRGVDVLREQFDRAFIEPKEPIVVKLDDVRKRPIEPLEFVLAESFEDQPVPKREWLVEGRIPTANVSLLGGDGAVGKTLLALMLSVAVIRGIKWLGVDVLKAGPVIFFSAQEDKDEVHRRLDAIIAHEGIRFADLNNLHLHSAREKMRPWAGPRGAMPLSNQRSCLSVCI
jgi:AAA domain